MPEPTDEVVQRVARAIYEAWDGYVTGVPWDADILRPGTLRRERYERLARAAIEAGE